MKGGLTLKNIWQGKFEFDLENNVEAARKMTPVAVDKRAERDCAVDAPVATARTVPLIAPASEPAAKSVCPKLMTSKTESSRVNRLKEIV